MANHHVLLVSFPDAAALGLMLGERRRNHALEAAAADALELTYRASDSIAVSPL